MAGSSASGVYVNESSTNSLVLGGPSLKTVELVVVVEPVVMEDELVVDVWVPVELGVLVGLVGRLLGALGGVDG
ncbi:hypothetical protein B9Q04_07045 [Candidatus Marsarchaeota G2 archaeon BE_D]|uniref:Uncharacterized protein n=1 Tax=Candidatus Marsarchaeota G2 archaeon BE_D TaxID=1978158 RepID=A0A2R6CB72_9ARCH|nr:MAG: hypothetical protein B9Q04_07045 [Candidatus Marsarchaeota G2 archaeon BE_D]